MAGFRMKAFFLLAVMPLGGCAWLSDRGSDFMDIGALTVDWGEGYGIHAQVTDLLRIGHENKEVSRCGADGRLTGLWDEERRSWSVGPLGSHELTYVNLSVVGVDYWDRFSRLDPWPSAAKAFTRQRFAQSGSGVNSRWRDRQVADIGYSLHLGWLGISHFFKPLEFVDFLGGFLGLDMAGDDVNWKVR